MNGTAKVATGVLCAAAIGAAAGLLFAPKSGAELRGDIRRNAHRIQRRASGLYHRTSDAVGEMADRSARAIEHAGKVAGAFISRG